MKYLIIAILAAVFLSAIFYFAGAFIFISFDWLHLTSKEARVAMCFFLTILWIITMAIYLLFED